MQKYFLLMMLILASVFYLIYTDSSEASGILAGDLNLIPASRAVGKGGYSISIGAFSYNPDKITRKSIEVDAGNYLKEKHKVDLQSDIWLTPIRITYGMSKRLDFIFGTTYSAGDTDKSIYDYYETGEAGETRAYPQVVQDGILGMKYIVSESIAGSPDLAIGGEIHGGYTVDDEFTDETIRDSFPFVAMQLYLSASYDLKVAGVHGAAGVFVSSKSIESDDNKFELPIQAGLEIPFVAPFDKLTVVLDIAWPKASSGVDLGTVISGGFRYDISSRATINASITSSIGFLIGLTVNGGKPVVTAPPEQIVF